MLPHIFGGLLHQRGENMKERNNLTDILIKHHLIPPHLNSQLQK